jgi:hypothetical protein
MGSNFAKGRPVLGPHRMPIHDLSRHPRPPFNLNTSTLMPGQRTLPIPGAPRVPPNPLLSVFRQQHKK